MRTHETLPGTRPEGARSQEEAARAVRDMFSGIVPRYDLLNRLLSLSFDRVWRRRAARAVAPRLASKDSRALDVCCGTGDLTLEVRRVSAGRVVGADFVHGMVRRAAEKAAARRAALELVEADALRLPFPDNAFDAVTVAFGLRNLADYRRGLGEMHRVLKPGGDAAILEFALPEESWFRPLYGFYFRRVLPLVGRLVSGHRQAYGYLPASVASFPGCAEFQRWMEETGFRSVHTEVWTAGIVALHCGSKE